MLWRSIKIASWGDSNRSPQHMILWRTKGNYTKHFIESGLLKMFNGHGDVPVMNSNTTIVMFDNSGGHTELKIA